MAVDGLFRAPFQEQLSFFRRKIGVPTERWDDIRQSAHDRFFMVAGAMKADLVADLKGAVEKAIEKGESIEDFRQRFDAIVERHGWHGWTGEDTAAGRDWRTRIIYRTNLQTSWAAGRYRQLKDPDLLAVRPYWRYIHNDSVIHPRPMHKHWGDIRLTLRHDDPFWETHYPPNGWNCGCRVKAVRSPEDGDSTRPPDGWDAIDAKTGAPKGIDKGWDYAPGAKAEESLRRFVQEKLISYPPAISRALSADVNRYVAAQHPASEFAAMVLEDHAIDYPAWLGFPENFERIEAETGHDVRGFMGLLPADAPRHAARAHAHDGHGQRPIVPDDYDRVWQVLTEADELEPGHRGDRGLDRIVASKQIGAETYRAVFEVRPGKRNRSLALISLVVKTGG